MRNYYVHGIIYAHCLSSHASFSRVARVNVAHPNIVEFTLD